MTCTAVYCYYPGIAVMHQTRPGPAPFLVPQPQRHLQGVQHELGTLVRGSCPADDGPRVHPRRTRQDHGGPAGHVGKAGDPPAVGAGAVKSRLTRSPARFPSVPGTVVRTLRPRRTPCRPSSRISRSTVHLATAGALPVQLQPDLVRAVDLIIVLPHARDLGLELPVADRPGRGQTGLRRVVVARCDRRAALGQHAAD